MIHTSQMWRRKKKKKKSINILSALKLWQWKKYLQPFFLLLFHTSYAKILDVELDASQAVLWPALYIMTPVRMCGRNWSYQWWNGGKIFFFFLASILWTLNIFTLLQNANYLWFKILKQKMFVHSQTNPLILLCVGNTKADRGKNSTFLWSYCRTFCPVMCDHHFYCCIVIMIMIIVEV